MTGTTSTVSRPERGDEDKRHKILGAAFDRFAAYGFRRTSMEDIARAAGMSRPALYLYFRNKEDVYRSLVQGYFERASAQMQAALAAQNAPLEDTLLAAFRAKDTEAMEVILTSEHGAELLDAGTTSCAECVQAGEALLRQHLVDWLARGAADGWLNGDMVTRDPAPLAGAIMAALKGLKSPPVDPLSYRRDQAQLARLFARALAP